MRVVLQRVKKAFVEVDKKVVGNIDYGYVVFLGIGEGDDKSACEKMAEKIFKLRINADENGKTNLSIKDVGGSILIVSQFTQMADCSQNRPSFSRAAKPDIANQLYEYFIEVCRQKFDNVQCGQFAAHMNVCLENDGPFTLTLEG